LPTALIKKNNYKQIFSMVPESFSKRTMGLVLLVMAMLAAPTNAGAQANKLPPFRIMQSSGKVFRAEDLPMGKPILLIYFSPDCDHCEKMLKEFFGKAVQFKEASVAMITYLTLDKVAKFEKDYPVKKYANIYTGTEGTTFFVRDYFKITEMPFAVLYTKTGDFVQSYSRQIPLKDLATKLKSLH
jgi:thioredoxin-related protein